MRLSKNGKIALGEVFLERLSEDLLEVFPDVKGFSKRNLELIRKWYLF